MPPQETETAPHQSFFTINLFVKILLVLVIVIAVAMPLLHYFHIYPLFTQELQRNTEEEAIQSATHLIRTLFQGEQKDGIIITNEIRRELENVVDDHSLIKIKIFSDSGEVIYSTDEQDVGIVNSSAYFDELVKNGKPVTESVSKGEKTLEGQTAARDVLETYVPIMRSQRFIGALEIYSDITPQKKRLDQLIAKITYQLFLISFLLINTIALVFLRLGKMLKDRQMMEEKLQIFADTDQLTQLYNRRRFLEYLEDEISRFLRYNHPASLLMFDIDHFKNVNDSYGHQTGDTVLREVAATCKAILRDNDLIGRYGGEEFIVLLLETDEQLAMQVAEKLRRAVEELHLPAIEKNLSVTISIGIALFRADKRLSKDVLIDQADKALYAAKESGRNRIVCYRPEEQ